MPHIFEVMFTDSGNNFSGYAMGAVPTALWTGEETILFTEYANTYFCYQRMNEEEPHKIQCLEDKRYCDSEIVGAYLTVEGQKVIGLFTVAKPGVKVGLDLSQKEIRNDLLFEINPDTDTSSIIYSTKNNRTRIIGYKMGMVYLLQDGVIYREKIDGTDREELLDLQDEGWDLYQRTIYFDWHGNNLIIWGIQEGTVRIESLQG